MIDPEFQTLKQALNTSINVSRSSPLYSPELYPDILNYPKMDEFTNDSVQEEVITPLDDVDDIDSETEDLKEEEGYMLNNSDNTVTTPNSDVYSFVFEHVANITDKAVTEFSSLDRDLLSDLDATYTKYESTFSATTNMIKNIILCNMTPSTSLKEFISILNSSSVRADDALAQMKLCDLTELLKQMENL